MTYEVVITPADVLLILAAMAALVLLVTVKHWARVFFAAALAVALIGLAACASGPPRAPDVQTVEVKVPVAVPCDPKVSPEPDWAEVERQLRSADAAEILRGAYAGYKMARAYIREQATGLKACATVTPPAP